MHSVHVRKMCTISIVNDVLGSRVRKMCTISIVKDALGSC